MTSLSNETDIVADIIALLGVVVAIIAWRWPRPSTELPPENVEIVPPLPSTPEVAEKIDIPFPPGLFIYEYEPGARLRLGEYILEKHFNKLIVIGSSVLVIFV
jgi:hypothetical protein